MCEIEMCNEQTQTETKTKKINICLGALKSLNLSAAHANYVVSSFNTCNSVDLKNETEGNAG